MPGAFLKGNISFPNSTFIVNDIFRPWNIEGVEHPTIINDTDFTTDSYCVVEYYKLKNIVFLYIDAFLKPTSLPYTNIENDTAYIYTGDFLFSRVNTTVNVRLSSVLTAASYHYETSGNVEDIKTGVFFDTSISSIMGIVHLNGALDSTMLVITIPSGMLPNHEYRISGTLIYECL
jgi:hypothetical protein